jgi:hypothetical protein
VDPKTLAGSGFVTRGCGFGSESGSEIGREPYQKSSNKFVRYRTGNFIIMTLKIPVHYSNMFFEK